MADKTGDTEDQLEELRRKRLESLLQMLGKQQGLTQGEIARRISVPPQHLSDVKFGRRSLSELFARRFQDEFGVDHQWLLGARGSMEVPRLDRSSTPPNTGRVWLPVFANPISGDPFTAPAWDGTTVELAGVAAARILHADRPYVLRFGAEDRLNRVRYGDLLLVTQAIDENAEVQVLKAGREMFLARRNNAGQWERELCIG
jgi:transcriptional regulator with XRE-family HTH domain